ncbi:helix-turn-helix domain-containing protein [Allorhizobium sp. BGMRC 0089]|uniref:helix-turn-helix domain-containing protein n=1 Tax=Allorhizobium sonneratiae TaxID=2934936 RepID=UPI0020338B53|nr:S24 family peptidase [Allorhizobium sonneratiae]MCM2292271.1 helix-turn-helix domain-containing protein [Allorhizobium sonneratiae]
MTNTRKIDEDRGQRIKEVRTDILKLKSQEELAQLLSTHGRPVTRGAVGNWERGAEVSIESLSALCKLAGVNLDWLAFNRPPKMGNLVSSFDPDQHEPIGHEIENYSRESWKPAVNGAIPELDVRLGAGSGTVGDLINVPVSNGTVSGHKIVAEWLLPEDYLRHEIKVSPSQTVVFEVIGDSMQPSFQPGDRVLIDLSQNHFSVDAVYAISDGYAEPQIKRLQRIPFSNPTEVRIISDNPALESFTVALDRLTIIGRVCGHIARK